MTNMRKDYPIDLHSHTVASAHAYSTVTENARAAADCGLAVLATTNHTPIMADAPHEAHFRNQYRIPSELFGVRMLKGAELNIIDFDGGVDLREAVLRKQEICIASFHPNCLRPGTREQNTRAYLKAMENPHVYIIGHPNYANVPVDLRALAKQAAEHNVALELNNSSLLRRENHEENCANARQLLACCAEYGAKVSLGSDAHFWTEIGDFTQAVALLEQAQFPREQVICASVEQLDLFLKEKGAVRANETPT